MTELAPNAPASAADRFAEFKFGRIPIGKVSPVIEHGAYPAKAVEGEALPISARIYREGHDAVGATAVLTSPSGEQTRLDMKQIWPQGLGIWQAWPQLSAVRPQQLWPVPSKRLERPSFQMLAATEQLCELIDRARQGGAD